MNLDLARIEQEARDLYIKGGESRQQLVMAWEAISPDDQINYPEIALQTGKICSDNGNNTEARQHMDVCIKAWQDNPENLSRVYLMYAYLSRTEEDYETMQHFIAETQARTQDMVRLAECQLLLGDGMRWINPNEALQCYDRAIKYFMRARVMRPEVDYDVARAAMSAADTAFLIHMPIVAWRYQRQAEQAARAIDNPMLMSVVLARTGVAHEREGAYELAFTAFDEAFTVAQASMNPMVIAQSQYRRARLAIMIGDDRSAQELLTISPQFDQVATLSQIALLQGWLAAFNYSFQAALLKVEEVENLMRDDHHVLQRANLLRGFIAAQRGEANAELLKSLQDTLTFFTLRNMIIETSQTALILAWLHTLSMDFDQVRHFVDIVSDQVKVLGHATHLARLYQASIGLLGGWWSEDFRELVETAIKKHHSKFGVRVYAFGEPRVFIGSTELSQRDRYGQLGFKLLLYMLENKRAPLWEIIEALWEDANPETAPARFHSVMSSLKRALNIPDWCSYSDERRLYIVSPKFPHYYDADDFNATVKLFTHTDNPVQRLAQCLKIVRMYDTYAKTLEGDAFDDLRRHYEAQYARVLYSTQEFLPDLMARMPRNWYDELTLRLQVTLERD